MVNTEAFENVVRSPAFSLLVFFQQLRTSNWPVWVLLAAETVGCFRVGSRENPRAFPWASFLCCPKNRGLGDCRSAAKPSDETDEEQSSAEDKIVKPDATKWASGKMRCNRGGTRLVSCFVLVVGDKSTKPSRKKRTSLRFVEYDGREDEVCYFSAVTRFVTAKRTSISVFLRALSRFVCSFARGG